MKGIRNCHTMGLDSIILDPGPPLTRVFIANEDHDLWKNKSGEIFSLGFHPHHCDVVFTAVRGNVWNVEPCFKTAEVHEAVFRRYEFDSVLMGGKGGFKAFPITFDVVMYNRPLPIGIKIGLTARALHTIRVEKGQSAAWLVNEGAENRNYKALCYSNADLSKWTADGLYQPMTDTEIQAALDKIGIGVRHADLQTSSSSITW